MWLTYNLEQRKLFVGELSLNVTIWRYFIWRHFDFVVKNFLFSGVWLTGNSTVFRCTPHSNFPCGLDPPSPITFSGLKVRVFFLSGIPFYRHFTYSFFYSVNSSTNLPFAFQLPKILSNLFSTTAISVFPFGLVGMLC